MAEVKWLLVGTGDIVQKRVADALARAQNSRVVGVCGSSADRVAAIAAKVGADERYTDLADALTRTSADAAYVARPVFAHSADAIAAIHAGKHVLVEKPLGLNHTDAARIVAAADGTKLRAGCAYYRRCSPRFAHAKKMIDAGQFGRIVLVRMTYAAWFSPEKTDPKYWRVVKSKSGGGPVADIGSHMFDILIGLFGLPRSIVAHAHTDVHSYEVEDTATALMTLADGAEVTAAFSWASKAWTHEMQIIGTEASLIWSPYDSGKVIQTIGRQSESLDLPPADNVHLPLVQDFVDAILDGRDPACAVAEAAKTNLLIDALYRSAESGKEVSL